MPFFHTRISSFANGDTGDRNNFQGSCFSPVQLGWCYSQQFPCGCPIGQSQTQYSVHILPEESLSLFSVIFMREFVRKQSCCALGDPVICVLSFNKPEEVLPQLLIALFMSMTFPRKADRHWAPGSSMVFVLARGGYDPRDQTQLLLECWVAQ